LHGRGRDREIPVEYASQFVELAYAITLHGAQGGTLGSAHVLIGEHTGAASAYVAMTRGREPDTAHLVAETIENARRQWTEVFSRDRADLGPDHARRLAAEAIDRYGRKAPRRRGYEPALIVPRRSMPEPSGVELGL
jgi:exodeoxyribonuclease V alpha subunit